eukprot:TRINITY_DN170_c1_g1_i1.p1 TRINITY_DN170_c1_g1~~TRINITY_DN170_c1_g1_i1.p1  ORF type:complete len:158 (+),score=33.25 TRINITY_DN170_c1_g1_i1:67-540(+)
MSLTQMNNQLNTQILNFSNSYSVIPCDDEIYTEFIDLDQNQSGFHGDSYVLSQINDSQSGRAESLVNVPFSAYDTQMYHDEHLTHSQASESMDIDENIHSLSDSVDNFDFCSTDSSEEIVLDDHFQFERSFVPIYNDNYEVIFSERWSEMSDGMYFN